MLIDNDDKTLVEKKISSEPVFDGVLLHVMKDEVELPNGHKSVREWIKHPGAAAIIPLLPDNQIILVRQFRYASSTKSAKTRLSAQNANFPRKRATRRKNTGNSRRLPRLSASATNIFIFTPQAI